MTTNSGVYCYTVTYVEYTLKLTKYNLQYLDSQSIFLICQDVSSLQSVEE